MQKNSKKKKNKIANNTAKNYHGVSIFWQLLLFQTTQIHELYICMYVLLYVETIKNNFK